MSTISGVASPQTYHHVQNHTLANPATPPVQPAQPTVQPAGTDTNGEKDKGNRIDTYA